MNPVLEGIYHVVKESRHVSIDQARLEEFCAGITPQVLKDETDLSQFDLQDRDLASRVDFSVIVNSINFCYWGSPKWTIEHEGSYYDGATGLAMAFRRAIKRGYPILDAGFLKKISARDLRKVLEGNVEIPLFDDRLRILKETGTVLSHRYDGHFIGWLRRADNDALRLVDVITSDIQSYRDSSMYKGKEVVFNKRAQLVVSDISRILVGSGLAPLRDISQLTAFAGYKIPQVLRNKGILVYSDELADRVDAQSLIASGSEEEVEIRANMVWAVELMRSSLAPRIPWVAPALLDSYLWLLGQVKCPSDTPYHHTLGTGY